MTTSQTQVHALTAERMPDFLRFFDGAAFSDNPKWGSCYCQCFYEDHRVVVWKDRTADVNRALACERGATGSMRGHLAYDAGGHVVGWCNAAPRALVHALDEEPVDDAHEVGSIVCFLVHPQRRGQGIARALLAAACEGLAAQGLKTVEAYPRTGTTDHGKNHFGPLALYLSAGFEIVRTDADDSVVVRKSLVR